MIHLFLLLWLSLISVIKTNPTMNYIYKENKGDNYDVDEDNYSNYYHDTSGSDYANEDNGNINNVNKVEKPKAIFGKNPSLQLHAPNLGIGGNSTAPKNELLVYIYNKKYTYCRLAHWSGGCGFFDGNIHDDQLWLLEESNDLPGWYFIKNWYHGDRYAFNPPSGGFCYNEAYYNDQLWQFVPASPTTDDGWFYYIQNYVYTNCRFAMWGLAAGGVYCGPHHEDQQFKLVNVFYSTAGWSMVDSFQNSQQTPVPYTFRYTEGFSETITNSVAMSTTTETSLKYSVGLSLDILNLGSEMQLKVTQSFSRSYTNAMQHQYTVERTMGPITINQGECKSLEQIQISNADSAHSASFPLSTNAWRLINCRNGTVIKLE